MTRLVSCMLTHSLPPLGYFDIVKFYPLMFQCHISLKGKDPFKHITVMLLPDLKNQMLPGTWYLLPDSLFRIALR